MEQRSLENSEPRVKILKQIRQFDRVNDHQFSNFWSEIVAMSVNLCRTISNL